MGNQLCGACAAVQEKLETKNLFQMFSPSLVLFPSVNI